MKALVRPKQVKNMVLIPKIVPEESPENAEEINKLNFDAKWKETDQRMLGSNNNFMQVYPLRGSQDLHNLATVQEQVTQGSQANFDGGY